MYTPWCDDDGKIIDDGILSRLDEDVFRLTSADPTLHWLEDNAIGLDITVEETTEAYAVLALQGPYSRALLNSLADADFNHLPYFRLVVTSLAGIQVIVSRTGFTGDLGYEIWVESHQAVELWDAIFEAGEAFRLRPFGEIALDMARIEAGYLLANVDYISAKKALYEYEKSSPYEVGLEWTVKLNKEFFVGQRALREERARGPAKVLVGLEINLKSLESVFSAFGMPLYLPYESWRAAVPVYSGGQRIGKATSGTWSPMLKKYIAIAQLKPRYARLGTQVNMEVTIDAHRKEAAATVVKMPFFNPSRKTSLGDAPS
jgi:aminomethyltransferase